MKIMSVIVPAVAIGFGLASCSENPLAIKGSSSQTLMLSIGQELDLTLGTIGPGLYQSPAVSSPSVQFLGSSIVPPYTPGGPTQQYRFRGASLGQAIIVITRSGGIRPVPSDTVADTVVVR